MTRDRTELRISGCAPGLASRSAAVCLLLLALVIGTTPRSSQAYSFLTHDDMIDVAWSGSIRPLLLRRFPHSTPAELRRARAFAYGGATIQDMGYYPFGHQFFSNLTHYVRTGDFVDNLLQDSRTLDEYAFAIGALSHYVGDNDGHRYATNVATPVEFPKLGEKFGPSVTYDEAPYAHIRTEFAFDVEQLSRDRLAPIGYRRSVSLYVPLRLLNQAFAETYGLTLRSVLGAPRPAARSYRSSVTHLLPEVADAEVLIHRKDFPPEPDTPAVHDFRLRQQRSEQENGWGKLRRKPGVKVHVLAVLIRVVPKLGPLSCLAIRGPSAETDRWYVESRNRTAADYDRLLDRLARAPRRSLDLPDRDLDTGDVVRPGRYALTDQTYAKLLGKLTAHPSRPIPAALQRNILAFYSNPTAPIITRKNAAAWKRIQSQLGVLKGMTRLS